MILIFGTIDKCWLWLHSLLRASLPAYVSLSSLVIGAVFLIGIQQGKETLILVAEDGGYLEYFSFIFSVCYWAWNNWLWAKVILLTSPVYEPYSYQQTQLRAGVPTAIGVASFIIALLAIIVASEPYTSIESSSTLTNLAVLGGILTLFSFLFFLWSKKIKYRFINDIISIVNLNRSAMVSITLSLLFSIALIIYGMTSPISYSELLGTEAITLIAIGSLLPVASLFAYWGKNHRFPILISITVFLILLFPSSHRHAIRTLADSYGAVVNRPTLESRIHHIQQRNTEKRVIPILLIASSGGGLRAAYWTTLVLDKIVTMHPCTVNYILAISPVSGGALGSVSYIASLNEVFPNGFDCTESTSIQKLKSAGELARKMTGGNFIGPLVAGFLYRDVPLSVLPLDSLPDRSAVMEQSWESYWRKLSGSDLYGSSFLGLWNNYSWPALFINGTLAENGQQAITSNLSLADVNLTDAADILLMLGADVRVSTSITNSARFPYLMTSGAIFNEDTGTFLGHLGDGGYLENFGARTTEDLLNAVIRFNHHHSDVILKPIVIQISSDPALQLPEDINKDQGRKSPSTSLAPQFFSPALTLEQTRLANSNHAFISLKERSTNIISGGHFFHFRMCQQEGEPDPLLGWSLTQVSKDNILSFLEHCNNREQLNKLTSLLNELL